MVGNILYIFFILTFTSIFITCTSKSVDRTEPWDTYDFNSYEQKNEYFREMIELMSGDRVKELQKNIKEKDTIWKDTFKQFPEMKNVQLFDAYQAQHKDQDIKYKDDVQIQEFFNTFKKLLEDPSDLHTQEFIDCMYKIKSEDRDKFISNQCNNFNNFDIQFSKATLAWLKYWNFIMQDKNTDYLRCNLSSELEQGQSILSTWQRARTRKDAIEYPVSGDKGKFLWDILSNALKQDNSFDNKNIEKHASIVVKCLDKLYIWSSTDFHQLTIKDYQTTIPHGLTVLSDIIKNNSKIIKDSKDKKAIEALDELEIYVKKARDYVTMN